MANALKCTINYR